jgi:hypothetical protein
MKVESSLWRITSTHFLERARLYGLAAAIAEARRDVAMFRDLATMFEQLAQHFWSSTSETAIAPISLSGRKASTRIGLFIPCFILLS